MVEDETQRLRILIANERRDRLELLAQVVAGLGHEVIAREVDVTLQRFTEYHNLQGAFGRRAVIEQAKGILMARHSIDADKAFGMLRRHSQHSGNKLVDVANAIVDSHLLLVQPTPPPEATQAA